MSSNYPPGYSGGIDSEDNDVHQICKNGHVWTAAMYSELGGGFYLDEDLGPVCPVCKEESLDKYPTSEQIKAYEATGAEILHQGKSMAYPEDDYLGEN